MIYLPVPMPSYTEKNKKRSFSLKNALRQWQYSIRIIPFTNDTRAGRNGAKDRLAGIARHAAGLRVTRTRRPDAGDGGGSLPHLARGDGEGEVLGRIGRVGVDGVADLHVRDPALGGAEVGPGRVEGEVGDPDFVEVLRPSVGAALGEGLVGEVDAIFWAVVGLCGKGIGRGCGCGDE